MLLPGCGQGKVARMQRQHLATQLFRGAVVVNQVIGQPTFPTDSLARIKNQLLASFEMNKQNPGKLANLELMQRLYGSHPYAHPSEGTAQSIPGISREQLIAFHQRAYAAGNVVNHADKTWLSLVDGNAAKPGAPGAASQWRLVGHARSFHYQVGDPGPGGGVIFFVDREDQFPGFDYLEAAPDDLRSLHHVAGGFFYAIGQPVGD